MVCFSSVDKIGIDKISTLSGQRMIPYHQVILI